MKIWETEGKESIENKKYAREEGDRDPDLEFWRINLKEDDGDDRARPDRPQRRRVPPPNEAGSHISPKRLADPLLASILQASATYCTLPVQNRYRASLNNGKTRKVEIGRRRPSARGSRGLYSHIYVRHLWDPSAGSRGERTKSLQKKRNPSFCTKISLNSVIERLF